MSAHYIKLITYVLLSLIVTVIYGCSGHGKEWEKLNHAEQLMETMPDSALAIIDHINVSALKGDEEIAQHALLKSMALDKNCIDTTTFDVLQPAIDYYLENGTADERLRTLYYQGRIYQNQGNDDSAMKQFMNALDLKTGITDSLLLARNFVALGTLYYKQYKIEKFIESNLSAAELYGGVGKKSHEIMSYANAIGGYIILNDKASADSILSVCMPLAKDDPDGEAILFPLALSYTIEYGTPEEIKAFLEDNRDRGLSYDDVLDFAQGYSKIGNHEKAKDIISEIKIDGSTLDSLKYISVKSGIFEKQGDYEQALTLFKEYSEILERYQKNLLSQDLLFADERHQLEVTNLIGIQKRDRIIWGTFCGSFGLLLLVCWLYYRYHLSRSRSLIAEKDNENLRLAQENLNKEKERIELERDKKSLETQNLQKERERLLAEQRQHELEAANMLLEIKQLEGERNNLKDLLKEQKELSKPIQEIIKTRLDILNSLLAKEISNNDNYAKPYHKWIESIHSDKNKFMNSTRLAFTASHPRLIEYLELHNLTIDEINYLCLYAIGLRGKEVGEYIQLKRHYNISSEIRKKLGIDEHETNIGLFIRKKMNEL